MKKLLVILGVITCMIGLCACGQEETDELSALGVDRATLVKSRESDVGEMFRVVGQGTYAIEQYIGNPAIYEGLLSMQSSMEDIGTFDGTNGGEVTVNGDEIIVDINVLGSKHNAEVEFIYDIGQAAALVGVAVNVKYTFGELMTKAALNTVIGMGTVFVVLIFISLIISCFGLFYKVGDKKSAEAKAVQSAAKVDPVVEQIAQKEELAGDAELVAVIAAAIAAYEGSGSTDGFVVRSIRKSNKSKWQNA